MSKRTGGERRCHDRLGGVRQRVGRSRVATGPYDRQCLTSSEREAGRVNQRRRILDSGASLRP